MSNLPRLHVPLSVRWKTSNEYLWYLLHASNILLRRCKKLSQIFILTVVGQCFQDTGGRKYRPPQKCLLGQLHLLLHPFPVTPMLTLATSKFELSIGKGLLISKLNPSFNTNTGSVILSLF